MKKIVEYLWYFVAAVIVLGVLALIPLYYQWAYGDWKCMVARCVIVK